MSRIKFCFLNKVDKGNILPVLFDLLYINMNTVTPFFLPYEQEKAAWLSNVSPALDKDPRQIILCYVDDVLAGFVQYYTRGDMLMIEEMQIIKEYQRTLLFGMFCKYIVKNIPTNLQYIEAYADRRNLNSRRIMEKLGMVRLDHDEASSFIHYRSDIQPLRRLFH